MSRRISKEVENRAIENKERVSFRKIPKIGQLVQKSPRKFSENPEIGEFPKNEPFNRKFWKFWKETQLNGTEIPDRKCLASKHFRTRRVNTELHAVN